MAHFTYGVVSSWTRTALGPVSVGFLTERGRRAGRGAAREDSSETVIAPVLPSRVRAGEWGAVTGGRLGPYRLIEQVGRGRQADVWRAARGEAGGEEVALKVLPASARDPRRRAQLKHEAERGARLVGPSLLPTYEFGEADGAVFMAMPLVVGCTLAEILDQRRAIRDGRSTSGAIHRLARSADRAYTRDIVAMLARIARAAAGAHDGRVVHRDIKPGNILVRRDHAEGVFLCDFGLARDLDVATPKQLRDGAGSPLYMAPERLLKQPADEVRGDVYALGITLSEALTLAPPVDVPEDMPPALWASFLAAAAPRRPSALWPTIPAALETAILRATSRDPSRRHPTAGHFADDLEQFLTDPYDRVRRPFLEGR